MNTYDAAFSDLYYFSRYMFYITRGYKWQKSEHHALICKALLNVYNGKTKRLIINCPPRYSKTELAVINFVAWTMGRHPDCEFIHASYSARLAAKNSWHVRDMVQHPEYRKIFPMVELRDDSKAKDEWRTTQGGCMYAVGAGGSITGYGAGKVRQGFGGAIIIDDIHKADEATSDVMRQNVIDWFQNTLESRRNSPETPIILIMQRLHENDLSGFLLGGGNGEQWEHLCLSAIKDDGTALWHEKHTIDDLNRMEEASPYVFAGQYRQLPAPPDGGTFKPERIPVISELLADTRFIRAWDLASTAGGGDWTVGAKIGLLKSGRWVIVDIVRLQGSPDQVETAIINTASLDGHSCVIQIPQDPAQAGKSQVAYLSRLLASYNVKAVRPTGSKEIRASGFAAQCNVGNVDMLKAPWNQTLINEMIMFPFGKHDDQIDACSDGFIHFSNNRPIITPIFRGI